MYILYIYIVYILYIIYIHIYYTYVEIISAHLASWFVRLRWTTPRPADASRCRATRWSPNPRNHPPKISFPSFFWGSFHWWKWRFYGEVDWICRESWTFEVDEMELDSSVRTGKTCLMPPSGKMRVSSCVSHFKLATRHIVGISKEAQVNDDVLEWSRRLCSSKPGVLRLHIGYSAPALLDEIHIPQQIQS